MLSLQFSPFPVLQTDRLVLRAITADDTDMMYEMRTNDTLMNAISKEKQNRNQTVEMINKFTQDWRNNDALTWAICLKDNKNLIGTIGFWRIEKTHYRAEIGYMLVEEHWRKGILTEAMNAVMDYGFNKINLHSVEGQVNPDNKASIALLEKFGFRKEAHFQQNYYFKGSFRDTAVYSKITDRADQL